MSTSKLISKDKLTAYERWELPNMADGQGKPEPSITDVDEQEALAQPFTAEQLEAIQQEAYQEGFEQGRQEGMAAGRGQMEAQAQRFAQLVQSLAEPLADVDAQVEQELVALAVEVARQLIRRELKIDPGQVVAVVREAVAALPSNSRDIRLILHPEDAVLVRETLPPSDSPDDQWRISEDATLTRGGCRVVCENSRIDASVEKRFAKVVADLLGGEREDDQQPT